MAILLRAYTQEVGNGQKNANKRMEKHRAIGSRTRPGKKGTGLYRLGRKKGWTARMIWQKEKKSQKVKRTVQTT